ncbi:helix-turn-helix domain-containing protein [Streptomyces murinus]|uniref:helix-turn-helix domain-containing protein n=1 Tax=Streptomyces murinus TaxID=33900 RepID=UPI00382CEED1
MKETSINSKMGSDPRRRLLTTAEAASAAGVSPACIRQWVHRGYLRPVAWYRRSGAHLFREDHVLLAERERYDQKHKKNSSRQTSLVAPDSEKSAHTSSYRVPEPVLRNYAKQACALTKMDPRYGVPALLTLAQRALDSKSAEEMELMDQNHRLAELNMMNVPSGIFHAFHEPGTSSDLGDTVASMCAIINYARYSCEVNMSGSNFANRVAQADPLRSANFPPFPCEDAL